MGDEGAAEGLEGLDLALNGFKSLPREFTNFLACSRYSDLFCMRRHEDTHLPNRVSIKIHLAGFVSIITQESITGLEEPE